jgi:large subunit ribosomal protein L24
MMNKKQKVAIKLKLKKGDEVIVIAGKDKGKRGTILVASPLTNKVLVEGVNQVKKHVRPNPQRNVQGGIVTQDKPIQASNVAIYNPSTQRADRIGYKLLEDGSKFRFIFFQVGGHNKPHKRYHLVSQ